VVPHFIDSFFSSHPWASDIAGSLLGVCITALLFVAGIVYERKRQRAIEARVYDDALYYFEQLLDKSVAWATHLARAYRNLADGLRRAPLLPAEFAQLSDSAAQRLLEIDRQLLFKAFLHRYGRATGTIDLYVSIYDGLDYVTTQSQQADAARMALLESTHTLEAQFRKHLDALLTQLTTASRLLVEAADETPELTALLDATLLDLHRLTLPGTELEEAFQVAVLPLHRALTGRHGKRAELHDAQLRTQKLLTIHAALVQRASDAATQLALLSTGLQLGAATIRSAQERLTAAGKPVADPSTGIPMTIPGWLHLPDRLTRRPARPTVPPPRSSATRLS
jgi:hypothetical protein